jgi:hypothetical protein
LFNIINFNCNSTEDFCIRIYSSNPINAQVVSTNHLIKQKIDEAFLRTIYFTIGLNSGKLAVPTNMSNLVVKYGAVSKTFSTSLPIISFDILPSVTNE